MEIDSETGARLHDIVKQAAAADAEKKLAEAAYDAAFAEAFNIFDRLVGPGNPARYYDAELGLVLERRVLRGAAKLNPEKLRALIGDDVFLRVARPTAWEIDEAALAQAIERGEIAPEAARAAIEEPPAKVQRWLRRPAKADADIIGVVG